MLNFQRRLLDKEAASLEELLTKEDSPNIRALLVILTTLNNTLQELSTTSLKVTEEQATLTKAYASFVNKGKGAWPIIVWVLGIIQVAFVYIGNELITENKTQNKDIMLLQMDNNNLKYQVQDHLIDKKLMGKTVVIPEQLGLKVK